jgi:hypothetical protein
LSLDASIHGTSIDHRFGKRAAVQRRKSLEATFQHGVHATAMQPQQSDGKLAKIVAIGADRKPARAA